MNRYLAQMPEGPAAMNESNDSSAGGDALGMARKMAMKLLSHYNDEIPYWYRLFLDSRQESPTQASGLLTNLSKIKDPQKRRSRIEAAKKELKLHGKKNDPKLAKSPSTPTRQDGLQHLSDGQVTRFAVPCLTAAG